MELSFVKRPSGIVRKFRSWFRGDPLRQRHQAERIVNDALWAYEFLGVGIRPEVREHVTIVVMLHIRRHAWQSRDRYLEVALDEIHRVFYGKRNKMEK